MARLGPSEERTRRQLGLETRRTRMHTKMSTQFEGSGGRAAEEDLGVIRRGGRTTFGVAVSRAVSPPHAAAHLPSLPPSLLLPHSIPFRFFLPKAALPLIPPARAGREGLLPRLARAVHVTPYYWVVSPTSKLTPSYCRHFLFLRRFVASLSGERERAP